MIYIDQEHNCKTAPLPLHLIRHKDGVSGHKLLVDRARMANLLQIGVTIVCLLVLLHFCAGTTTYCDDYNNGGSCVLRRVCEPPRQYRSSRGLNGSDTVCSTCPNGRYTTKVNADSCSLIPGINDFCPAGQGFISGQCTSCSSGYYNTGNFKELPSPPQLSPWISYHAPRNCLR